MSEQRLPATSCSPSWHDLYTTIVCRYIICRIHRFDCLSVRRGVDGMATVLSILDAQIEKSSTIFVLKLGEKCHTALQTDFYKQTVLRLIIRCLTAGSERLRGNCKILWYATVSYNSSVVYQRNFRTTHTPPTPSHLQQKWPQLAQQMERWADKYGGDYELRLFGRRCIVVTSIPEIRRILSLRPSRFKRGLTDVRLFRSLLWDPCIA